MDLFQSLLPAEEIENASIFFVNNRPVKDKTIQAAFNQAFRNFLEKDHFAEGYLFLSIPFNEVDVNVHPAKSEVRFEDTRPLYQFVFRCIEQAVLKEKGVKEFYKTSEETPRYWIKEKHHQPGFDYNEEKGEKEIFFEKETVFFEEDGRKETSKTILGQYLNAYIVASDEDGIVIIDQHNAHERIIYDGFQKIEQNEKWPRKLSLLSILMEFSAAQELSYENEKDFLQDIGFHIEHMGGKSYALKEFPALYKDDEAKEVFLALLEDAGDKKVEKKHHEILSTMACKAAIKYGEKLGREKMVFLVEELFNSSNPGVCPHGRPIVIKLTKNDIEKGLKRR